MSKVGVKVLLTSGRTLKQGRGMEIGKLTQSYFEAVSICEMDKTTLDALGVEDGDPVKVETEVSSVVVYGRLDRRAEPGVAFIPAGPYANALTDYDTEQTGMPAFKGIPATLYSAKGENVPSVKEVLKQIVEGK